MPKIHANRPDTHEPDEAAEVVAPVEAAEESTPDVEPVVPVEESRPRRRTRAQAGA